MSHAIPIRDDSRTPLAFVLSAFMHALLVGAVLAVFLWHPQPKDYTPQVFELLAGPPTADNSNESSQSSAGDTAMSMPDIATPPTPAPEQPIQQTQQTPVEQTPIAQQPTAVPPKPTPATAPKSASRQSSARSTVAPKPATTSRAATTPKTMSYSEWVKTHPAASSATTSSSSSATARATGRPVPRVGVNVGGIVNNLQRLGNRADSTTTGAQMAAGQNGTSDDYEAMLRKRVYDAFAPPPGYEGYSAQIRLTIAADGTITDKQLIRKSGNDIFDNAVRKALDLLTHVDPPPEGAEIVRDFVLVPKTS